MTGFRGTGIHCSDLMTAGVIYQVPKTAHEIRTVLVHGQSQANATFKVFPDTRIRWCLTCNQVRTSEFMVESLSEVTWEMLFTESPRPRLPAHFVQSASDRDAGVLAARQASDKIQRSFSGEKILTPFLAKPSQFALRERQNPNLKSGDFIHHF
jgi:hypothetical protein